MKHIMNEIDLQTGKVLVSLLERIPHDTEDCDPKRILNITLNTLHIEKKRARSRRILKVISVIAACLVLAVSLPFAWPLLRQYIPMGETIPDDITLPCPMEEMYWKDNTPTSCHSGKTNR